MTFFSTPFPFLALGVSLLCEHNTANFFTLQYPCDYISVITSMADFLKQALFTKDTTAFRGVQFSTDKTRLLQRNEDMNSEVIKVS